MFQTLLSKIYLRKSNMSEKESVKLVNAIVKGKNVKAQKTLEKILKEKCAERIKSVLKN